jgi:hypothetical protein
MANGARPATRKTPLRKTGTGAGKKKPVNKKIGTAVSTTRKKTAKPTVKARTRRSAQKRLPGI